jgi:hypothetical protein
MLTNHAELADYMGASRVTEDSMSSRLYKDTECGAWLVLLHPKQLLKLRTEVWTMCLRQSIVGPVCLGLRKRGETKLTPEAAPSEVRDFMDLEFCGGHWLVPKSAVIEDPWHFFLAGPKDCKVTRRGSRLYVTTKVEVPCSGGEMLSAGVRIGSIVEGTDAEVPPVELRYPFSEEDWEKAVQKIEEGAQEIWNDTHGCESFYAEAYKTLGCCPDLDNN